MKIVVRIIPPSKWKRNYLLNHIKKHKLNEMVFPTNSRFNLEVKDADVLVSNKLTRGELKLARKLKFLIIPTSGTENIDLIKVAKQRITILQNKDIIAKAVASYTLNNLKKIINQSLKDFLNNKRIGILGFGSIGKSLVINLSEYNCRFLIIKRKDIKNTKKRYKLYFISGLNKIDYVIKNSDIIINTLPRTKETKGLLMNKTNLLKKGAIIINLSRKGIINERQVLERVKNGALKGAIFDVYSNKIDESKYQYKNIILTSHIAGIYGTGLKDITRFVISSSTRIIHSLIH